MSATRPPWSTRWAGSGPTRPRPTRTSCRPCSRRWVRTRRSARSWMRWRMSSGGGSKTRGSDAMRHPRDGELDRMAPLLEQLRTIDGLVERKTGVFYRRSKAFLHFHVDGDDFYADVRLDGGTFDRMRVTTRSEQRALVATVRRAVAPLR